MKREIDEREYYIKNVPLGIIKAKVGSKKIEIVQANQQYYDFFGTAAADYKEGIFARFGENDRRMYEAYVRQRAADHENFSFEYKTTHKKTEKTVWVKLYAVYIGEEETASGKAAIYYGTYIDITRHKLMTAELDEMKTLYLSAISCSDELIFDYLIDTDVFSCYRHREENGRIVNKPQVIEDFLVNMGKNKTIYPDDLVYFYDLCRENITHPFDIRVRWKEQKAGEYTRTRVHASVQKNEEGRPFRIIGTIRPLPVGEELQQDHDEEYEERDELTGLLSRTAARKQIEEFKANSSMAISYALMILDIKDFRKVNDAYGHMFGDNVLVQVADIIIEIIGKTDIAARLGGDEFLIFLKNVSERSISRMCEKMCKEIRNIYVGEDLSIDSCIGAVNSKDPGVAYDDLLQTADDALFELLTSDKTGVHIAKEISYHNKGLRLSYVADRNLRKETSENEKRLSELVFELLEKAKDIERAIYTVLALVGERKNLSRITVMRRIGMEKLEVTYQWTARGVRENKKIDGKVILDYQERMRDNFTEDGMGIIDEYRVSNFNNSKKDIILPAGCKSLMYCDMLEFGEPTGMIAYVDCTGKREWTDTDFKSLRTITRLISAYTLKARAIEKEEQ